MVGQLGILTPVGVELALYCALGAWAWCEVLTQPGMIAGWWPGLVRRTPLPEWAHKPLYACAQCCAGFSCLIFALALGQGAHALPASVLAVILATAVGRFLSW